MGLSLPPSLYVIAKTATRHLLRVVCAVIVNAATRRFGYDAPEILRRIQKVHS